MWFQKRPTQSEFKRALDLFPSFSKAKDTEEAILGWQNCVLIYYDTITDYSNWKIEIFSILALLDNWMFWL